MAKKVNFPNETIILMHDATPNGEPKRFTDRMKWRPGHVFAFDSEHNRRLTGPFPDEAAARDYVRRRQDKSNINAPA